MQTVPFPLTKLHPPRSRTNLVARAQLEETLGQAMAGRRITLVSAPAGFGKTAAVTRQLDLLPEDVGVAWISADADDDLHRFLACLIAALEPFDLPWRVEPDALIAAAVGAQGQPAAIVAHLINALAASDTRRGLIVIDDAHRIPDPAVWAFVDLLLERLPDAWGMVISTRVDPPLSLARLRARGELLEVRHTDLRFAANEVEALIAASDATADAASMLARTGGWAAGLRLTLNAAAHGHGTPALRESDRHVLDYLAAEVLDELDEELREFLLMCSVLPELTVARCNALTGNTRAGPLLEELERSGLFVSVLDGPEHALTLHDLLRDCLTARLRRDHPDVLPELLRRAADAEPDPIRRLAYLFRADAWNEAEFVLEEVATALLATGAVEPVLRLVEQFPRTWRDTSAMLAFVRAQVAWAQWDWRVVGDWAHRARLGFERSADAERTLRARIMEAVALVGNGRIADSAAAVAAIEAEAVDIESRALVAAVRAWNALDTGDFRGVASRYGRMLDVLEQTDRLEIWFECFQRPLYIWMPGIRTPIARFVSGVMRHGGDRPTLMRTVAYVASAWLEFARGDLPQALERALRAQDDARWLGNPTRLRMFVAPIIAAVHAARGDRSAMMPAVETMITHFDPTPSDGPPERPTSFLAHYVFFAIRLADAAGADDLLEELVAKLSPPAEITNYAMLRAPLATVPARVAALKGRHEEACGLWSGVLSDEASIDVIGLLQEVRVRYADSLLRLGRTKEAAVALAPVFSGDGAEMGGAYFAGRETLSRLATASWGTALDARATATLRRLALQLGPAADSQTTDERLSARELEVLARIAAGDSNKLIARALDLSPHTVKRHVANILDKLALNSRREAADWYQARG